MDNAFTTSAIIYTMIHFSHYDTTYHPSLPIVEITVKNSTQEHQQVTLKALVDSGADGTMIPLHTLKQIKATQTGWIQLKAIPGISYRVPVYTVRLAFGTTPVGVFRVAGDKQNGMMILGRDVLNLFVVTLDALGLVVKIEQ